MSARPMLNKAVPDAYKTTIALSEHAEKAALDAGVEPLAIELVRIRASQINGCGFCLRMHVRDALAKGETTDRIAVLPAWRETSYFSPAERAALAIAEEITHINTRVAGVDEDTTAVSDEQAAALRWVDDLHQRVQPHRDLEPLRRPAVRSMSATLHRVLLGFLTLVAVVTGVWAYFAPQHWYDTFPGLGLSWLPQLGPYNQHFVGDVGAFFLGLAVLSVATFIHVSNTTLVRVSAGAWSMFNLLHLILHLQMLHHYSARDQVLNVVTLSALLIASLALFVPVRQDRR